MLNNEEQAYQEQVQAELNCWMKKLLRPPGLLERSSKFVQTKINNQVIPKKVQIAITATVKSLVKSVLFGLDFIPKSSPLDQATLQERDQQAKKLLKTYKKIAAAEGAGTGAGGFVLAIADFPALIAIKMKFLFELAHTYGFSTNDYRERLFLLYVFQLAFSGPEKRPELYKIIRNWEKSTQSMVARKEDFQQVDWEQFQQDYRDALDFRKTLQLLPGLGVVVGAWANYGLLDDLGGIGINCYRLRIIGGNQLDKINTARN